MRNTFNRMNRLNLTKVIYGTTRNFSAKPPSPPAMLSKIRQDLVSAMKSKDSNRSTVLKGLLTQVLNASKTERPIHTELQMLGLLNRTIKESQKAAQEFKTAGRDELVEKEKAQINVLEEYAGLIKVKDEKEIETWVQGVINKMSQEGIKLTVGEVLKTLFNAEASEEKPAEKGKVVKKVNQILNASAK